jgi:ABC-type Fe3+/spermidine/putrescine transport system ATPase subunit
MVISDRVAVLNKGRVVQVGTPADLFQRPRSRFVAEFVGKTNLIEGVAADSGTVVRGPFVLGVASADLKPGAPVAVSIRPHQIRIASASSAAPSGPNVFRATVRRASYLGTAVDYQVDIDGTDVTLRVTAPDSVRLGAGEAVTLAIDPWSCVDLRAED